MFVKNYTKILFSSLCFLQLSNHHLYSAYDKMVNPSSIKIVSIHDLMEKTNAIEYIKCHDAYNYSFQPFPLSVAPETQPHNVTFNELFILKIPEGRVCSKNGWVILDNCFIKELIWRTEQFGFNHIVSTKFENVKKINGRVAVIAQPWCECYYHWAAEILGKLALLEMHGIEYDWLYIQTNLPFMKESLALWGIDPNKIINPLDNDTHYIEADELIVPSLVSKLNVGFTRFASYVPAHILTFVKNKLDIAAQQQKIEFECADRVFISRKDANLRKMLNEDDLFNLLKTKGFKNYNLSELSFVQQIQLFQNAKIIVAAHGAGLFNILFCQQGTKIIEIFQARGSATFWYQSQLMQLEHYCIKTMDFEINGRGAAHSYVPLELIHNALEELL